MTAFFVEQHPFDLGTELRHTLIAEMMLLPSANENISLEPNSPPASTLVMVPCLADSLTSPLRCQESCECSSVIFTASICFDSTSLLKMHVGNPFLCFYHLCIIRSPVFVILIPVESTARTMLLLWFGFVLMPSLQILLWIM